jgi:hypothetical protein
MHKTLLLVFALASLAVAAGWARVSVVSARSGTPVREIRGSVPLAVAGLVVAAGLCWLAVTAP